MAQFSTDFADSAYGTGSGSQPGDWSSIWGSDVTFTVELEAEESLDGSSFGDQVLKADVSAGSSYNGIVWDDVGTPTEADVKMRFRTATQGATTKDCGLTVRVIDDSNGADGYMLYVNTQNHNLVLAKFLNNSPTVITTHPIDEEDALYLTDDKWYCMRLQINGTAIKGKLWLADDDEPGSWQIEETDASVSAAGAVGLTFHVDSYVDWFGAGTGGDAPPAFPATEAEARVTQAVVEVLRSNPGSESIVVVIG